INILIIAIKVEVNKYALYYNP
ncbi:MAG: hypothetical protein H6Q45_207, partial [Deltaproteobacteria bacterium]|nr:hypothetical protein [Deltaproteobacteria bacterium]